MKRHRILLIAAMIAISAAAQEDPGGPACF
jgi:hypothetical protein